ncbi:nuclear factor 7, ovary-like [Gadus chalcogrammus]|uniref:nuclear factor 7, ovary-like n=1 Tax=Gadus chalcogrammus TaxID=1042646 RepID=UPI0024C3744C|nr:nuclear factor 7, ovary-like [Gadus chalcogrammus]
MSGKMAEEVLKSFLTCQVCCETFKDPVSLCCYHNFCRGCLESFWELAKNKNCPTCKRRDSKDTLLINFGLQELVDSYAGRQRADPPESRAVCRTHTQDLKWCEEEQRVVCLVCDQQVHGLTLVPLEDEVRNVNKLLKPQLDLVHNVKVQLKPQLESLKKKMNEYKEIYDTYGNMGQHCKKQLGETERQIKAEFDQLHKFLIQEEEDRMAALKEEEKQKRETIILEQENIQAQMSVLSEVISAVEQDLPLKDNAAFLTLPRDLLSGSAPQLLRGGLVDVAKHLGNLSFRVWEKMREKIRFTPVILDPNTASNRVVISEDLTSARHKTGPPQEHPENPERFSDYSNFLGSVGFTSGRHSWEVEVGDHPDWLIGVAKETVDRKGGLYASPENGFWCLFHYKDGYSNGSTERLNLERNPTRIRVLLDCGEGEVSFYDAGGNDLILSYRDTFSEKIFPFFCVWAAGEAQTVDVKVCGAKRDLNVN